MSGGLLFGGVHSLHPTIHLRFVSNIYAQSYEVLSKSSRTDPLISIEINFQAHAAKTFNEVLLSANTSVPASFPLLEYFVEV